MDKEGVNAMTEQRAIELLEGNDYNNDPEMTQAAYMGAAALREQLAEAEPTVDAAPVVHGHWNIRCESHQDSVTGEVDEEFYLECSECRRKVWDVSQDAIISGQYGKALSDFPYCHCGAKMDKEEHHDQR
jgi:hypothetical protein